MHHVDCPICITTPGIVMVRKDTYEIKHHCTCRLGDPHKYNGADCSDHKTRFYCASIDTLPSGTIDSIISENQKKYGIRKVGGRWMKPDSVQLSPETIADMRDAVLTMINVQI